MKQNYLDSILKSGDYVETYRAPLTFSAPTPRSCKEAGFDFYSDGTVSKPSTYKVVVVFVLLLVALAFAVSF